MSPSDVLFTTTVAPEIVVVVAPAVVVVGAIVVVVGAGVPVLPAACVLSPHAARASAPSRANAPHVAFTFMHCLLFIREP
jgi:hypothetical protein